MYISLFYNQGSSNKVYNLDIRQVENSFELYAVYGRVGKPMRQNLIDTFDTIEGATEEAGRRAHLKKLKGYAEDNATQVAEVLDTGLPTTNVLPQLANTIKDQAKLRKWIQDHNFCMQTKHDGERRIAGVQDGKVVASNRRGQGVTLNTDIAEELLSMWERCDKADFLVDGEDMGDRFIVFDVIQWLGEDLRDTPFKVRTSHVIGSLGIWNEYGEGGEDPIVVDSPTWPEDLSDELGKMCDESAFLLFKDANHHEEGIILRDADAVYTTGRPNSGGAIIKVKNVTTATCVAGNRNNSKRSISILIEDVLMGNVTIPPNYDIPNPGDFIEVEYLYAYPNGSLYQPVYKGVRTDKDCSDTLDSLRYKS